MRDTDPYGRFLKSYLRFDGSDGQTYVYDWTNQQQWTMAGGFVISDDQPLFGENTAYCDGASGSKLTGPVGSNFDFRGPFCLEGHVRFNSVAGGPEIITCDGQSGSHAGHGLGVNASGYWTAGTRAASNPNTTAAASMAATTGPVIDTWYHVAFSKDASNVHRLFVAGLTVASVTSATAVAAPAGRSVTIGQYYNDTERFNGYLKGWRFYAGTPKYTADFTPPSVLQGFYPANLSTPQSLVIARPPEQPASPAVRTGRVRVSAANALRKFGWGGAVMGVLPMVGAYGSKTLSGTVQLEDTTPLRRPVLVIDRRTRQVVRTIDSRPDDGTFSFADLADDRRYLVIALDELPEFNAARADDVTPV